MAKVTCAISGIRFNTNYLDSLVLPANEGFPHPIFAAPFSYLERMYSHHTRGNLTATDSYLLFLAIAHSSDSIYWEHPATLNPADAETKQLIENNLSQLLSVIKKTEAIKHPSFQQPKFKVTYGNCKLRQLPNWIKAWEENIKYFYAGRASQHEIDSLHQVEAKLSKLILSGEPTENYAHIVADWAAKAADFPAELSESYKQVIRSCFNTTKMFNTPLALIKEIKDYCEAEIEVGSIHFHALSAVLNEGISRHVDYLGGSSLALGYTLLPPSSPERSCLPSLEDTSDDSEREGKEASAAFLASIIEDKTNQLSAPPVRENYPDNLSFLKAKLAYRVKAEAIKNAAASTTASKGEL